MAPRMLDAEAIQSTLGPRGPLMAAAEQRFESFATGLGCEPDLNVLTLYLTRTAQAAGMTANRIRRELGLIDGARRLRGEPGALADPDLRRFLRGLHNKLPLGTSLAGAQPLYLEGLRLVDDELMREPWTVTRDVAFLLLANISNVALAHLCRLDWHDAKFTDAGAEISFKERPRRGPLSFSPLTLAHDGTPHCAICALRALRLAVGPGNGPLFKSEVGDASCGHFDRTPLFKALGPRQPVDIAAGPRSDAPTLDALIARLREPTAWTLRSRALLLLGFAACLTADEVVGLHRRDVRISSAGLLITLPNRRERSVAVPRSTAGSHCPVEAYVRWAERAQQMGASSTWAAFGSLQNGQLHATSTRYAAMSRAVATCCREAGLTGEYSWMSLRTGFIRSAARQRVAPYLIARQAGLMSLGSVQRHSGRELLLDDSVATRVGL